MLKITPIKQENLPKIIINEDVYRLMTQLTNNCDIEIGWLGFVKRTGNNFYVYAIEVPEQKCHEATTELSESSLQDMYEKYKDDPDMLNDVRFWGHSHVNMPSNPSTQDEDTFETYLECCDYFIRFIMNKKGKYTCALADKENGFVYENLTVVISNSPERKNILDRMKQIEEELQKYDEEKERKSIEVSKRIIKTKVKKKADVVAIKIKEEVDDDMRDSIYYAALTLGHYADIRVGNGAENILEIISEDDVIKINDLYSIFEIKKYFKNREEFEDYTDEDWWDLITTTDMILETATGGDYDYGLQQAGDTV